MQPHAHTYLHLEETFVKKKKKKLYIFVFNLPHIARILNILLVKGNILLKICFRNVF